MVTPTRKFRSALVLGCLAFPLLLATAAAAGDDPPASSEPAIVKPKGDTIVSAHGNVIVSVQSDEPSTQTKERRIVVKTQTQPEPVKKSATSKPDADAQSQRVVFFSKWLGDDEDAQKKGQGQSGEFKRNADNKQQEAEVNEWTVKAVHGKPPKVWLGIGLKEVTGDLATYLGSNEGILIETIFPESPAQAATLQEGDIVIALNGEKLEGPEDLVEALRNLDGGDAKLADRKPNDDGKADSENAEDKKSDETKAADGKLSDKRVTYPPISLTILRRGDEKKIEVTPTSRPESMKTGIDFEVQVGEAGELHEMLKDLPGGARVFRFGQPAALEGLQPSASETRRMVIVVKEEDDGNTIEIRVERDGDKPAKMILTDEKGAREITDAEFEQLPEKIRNKVAEALKMQGSERSKDSRGEKHAQIQAEVRKELERVHGQLREGGQARTESNKALREALQTLGELDEVIIVRPDVAANFGKSAEELAQRYQKLAEEVAKRGANKAKEFAAVPEQLQRLQKQVEELQKQIEELQAQLKAKQ